MFWTITIGYNAVKTRLSWSTAGDNRNMVYIDARSHRRRNSKTTRNRRGGGGWICKRDNGTAII